MQRDRINNYIRKCFDLLPNVCVCVCVCRPLYHKAAKSMLYTTPGGPVHIFTQSTRGMLSSGVVQWMVLLPRMQDRGMI